MTMFKRIIYFFVLIGLILPTASNSVNAAVLPNPVLVFSGQEPFSSGGRQFIKYHFLVFNADAYPTELFAPAPQLPPCGKNNQASRTWIDLYDQTGKRLYGFCAIARPQDLNTIFFTLEVGAIPPSWIYIEINDRQTNTKYKSNLAETTL
jgi:hypothetical protein